MKRIFLIVILLIGKEAIAQKSVGIASVPATESNPDWLIQSTNYKATIAKSTDSKEIVLDNGLVRRVFRLTPNATCIDYTNKINGRQLIRAVSPEARVVINGRPYNVGGLYGQKEKAYRQPQ